MPNRDRSSDNESCTTATEMAASSGSDSGDAEMDGMTSRDDSSDAGGDAEADGKTSADEDSSDGYSRKERDGCRHNETSGKFWE